MLGDLRKASAGLTLLFDFPMVDYFKSEREEWELKNGKTRLLSVRL
jgi:hypothetical protein